MGFACGLPQAASPATASTIPRIVIFTLRSSRPLIARDLPVEQMNLAARVRRNVVFVRH